MYVLLPLLFRWKRVPAGLVMLPAAIVLGAIQIFGAHHLPHSGLSRFSVLQYAPCFIPGILAYRQSKTATQSLAAWTMLPVIAALLLAYTRWNNPYVSWGICLVVGLGLPRWKEWGRENAVVKASHYIAKYSYGIYLTHMLSLWIAFVVLRSASLGLRVGVFALLLVALPVALYHLIEEPCIRLGGRLVGRARVEQSATKTLAQSAS
ncbi:MAG: hypothetical protein NVS9B15_25510 [Acidobacteriaceae bacterium]